MARPKLLRRFTIRLYDELLSDVRHVAASRRFRSTNEYVLHCLEYEMRRAGVHGYPYSEILPVLNRDQGRRLSDRTHLTEEAI